VTPLSTVLRLRHLPALDGIRALSVFTVIFYHAGIGGVPGDLGVTAFFVLSGFLITLLLLREQDRTGTIDLRAFYTRRMLRIFPAYYALVIFSLVVDWLLQDPWTLGRVLTTFTYTLNYHNALFGHEGPLAHGWSLAVEEQFYLLWPAFFLILLKIRRIRLGLVLGILGALLWRCLIVGELPEHYLYNAFETRLDSLAIGCLMAVLCQSPTFVRQSERIAKPWAPILVLAMLYVSRTQIGGNYHYSLGFTVDSILIAVFILQVMQLSSAKSWRWIEHPVLRWVGMLSYPLYLWHIWGLDVGKKLGGGVPLGVAVSIALAVCSYYGLERYFLRLKDRMRSARPRKAGPVEAGAGAPLEGSVALS